MEGKRRKLIRAATVGTSLATFLDGMLDELKERYDVVLLSSPGAELEATASAHGVRAIGVKMERRVAPLSDLVSLVRLVAVFAKEKPAMVHSMTPKAGLLCMLAGWLTGVPRRVHTFTGLVWPTATGLRRRVLMLTDWLTCACATHVVPEGRGVMDDLQGCITRKPMRVLGYGNVRGVDLVHWSRRPEVAELADGIGRDGVVTFLFVGRVVGDKGIAELAEAMVALYGRLGDGVRLRIVGRMEPELDPIGAETLARLEGCPAIELVGPRSGDELVAEYAAADCFVLPSYREGFPNTVIEAGAMGLPSVVTDINGSREIVSDGVNGLVVASHDAAGLLGAMERMATDASARCAMAAKARPMVAERFEQGYVRRCLLEFYEEIG